MAVGAVRGKPEVVRDRLATASADDPVTAEGTPGLAAPGEMSSKALVGLVILAMGVVVALIGGTLRAGLHNPGGVDETGTPSSSTTQPVKAQVPPPAPAPAPAPAAPVQMPAPAPQTEQYVAPPAPVEATTESAAAPPPPPAPAPPALPDILAPILPFLLPPPPPPPPPAP
ncbi:hypothetical protein [Nocardia seriolae]|uniref:Vegetative cell wall protein gp1 n=1 Tax=Nocardia seriolae TaxID=37332 RepID=A0A0B8N200_9NOCA|nr:hypothetical protein [Nocardia seriolae]APB01163.1 Vegetative cell wall protein gp1 [Nocardia seriolae]MTJ61333.1 hypothetical protein [Nocardia seriolae]MTJ71745.1 hypothetical protein [Nocardia seriolae]MTJ90543.1 hypothetical protein [Nocardia seriolae]MTK34503.1 hypothetical protein [Nocardia seriolae]